MGLRMHRLNVQPTMACTLKCKLCNNLSPYYDTPPYHNIDCLKKELTTLFTLVDDIDILNISGGEPFLYRELDRLLHFLAENRNIIKKRLDIITNGTIIPDEKILCAIKAANASILLDDYGSERSKKAQQLKLLCEMENIDYRYRNYTSANPYFDGWLMSYERNKEPINEKEYVEFLHSKCMLVTGEQRPNIMMDGKLYICFCQYWLEKYNIHHQETAYYGIPSGMFDMEKEKSRLKTWMDFTDLDACWYCHGLLVDGKRYVPAEQI